MRKANANPFGDLQALRDRPFGDLSPLRERKSGYRSVKVDRSSTSNSEPLLEITDYGLAGRNHYAAKVNPPYYCRIPGATPQLLLRRSVLHLLQRVNKRLSRQGLEVFVFDAWRPRAVQAFFHDIWMPSQLRIVHPEISADELLRMVEMYWARPSDPESSPAPHSTGGVVDLTLRWKESREHLWMGSIFDDPTSVAHVDFLERKGGALSYSDQEARANRRLLFWLMTEGGFAPNPDEWWHYGFGDPLWACLSGNGVGVFDAVEEP